jgi:hypothetical protein
MYSLLLLVIGKVEVPVPAVRLSCQHYILRTSEVTKKRYSLLVGGEEFLSDLGHVKEVIYVLVAMQYDDMIESALTNGGSKIRLNSSQGRKAAFCRGSRCRNDKQEFNLSP